MLSLDAYQGIIRAGVCVIYSHSGHLVGTAALFLELADLWGYLRAYIGVSHGPRV